MALLQVNFGTPWVHSASQHFHLPWPDLPPGKGHVNGDLVCPSLHVPVPGERSCYPMMPCQCTCPCFIVAQVYWRCFHHLGWINIPLGRIFCCPGYQCLHLKIYHGLWLIIENFIPGYWGSWMIKDHDGNISSSLYRKPTTNNTFLHVFSTHPRTLLNSIPYSQYLWLRRNWSTDAHFKWEVDGLRIHLEQRGYSKKVLKRAYKRAIGSSTQDLLFGHRRELGSFPVKLITRYTHEHDAILNLIKKY